MSINPFFIWVLLGGVLYANSYLKKVYALLPQEFKDIENKYMPGVLKRDHESNTPWYVARENMAKEARRNFPKFMLVMGALIAMIYILNIELSKVLHMFKYGIIIAGILFFLIQVYYNVKIYIKYNQSFKEEKVEQDRKVFSFVLTSCFTFLFETILIISFANNPPRRGARLFIR